MALANRFLPNPSYGQGVFRRRIRLNRSREILEAILLDNYHEMSCSLVIRDGVIADVAGEITRAPFSTCSTAPDALNEIVGLSVDLSQSELLADGRAGRNCTHLFDMAVLAAFLWTTGQDIWEVETEVPDLSKDGVAVTASLNGAIVHRWTVDDQEKILDPVEFGRRSVFGGFSRWASEAFTGVPLALARVLQKAIFVARGRRYLIQQDTGGSLRAEPERIGACYTFSEPRFSVATSLPDYVREFPHGLPS